MPGVGAVAFSVNGDVDSEERLASLRLLARVFEDEPPDLLLLETMSLIRDDFTFRAVELALETGLPVWLSFRRCRHGVCGVYGQHWGGPEGDLFGRAARRFEELGVSALLINCLPPDHVDGDAAVAPRLHRSPARRLPEPRATSPIGAGASTSASGPTSTRSSRSAGAPRVRRSSVAAAERRPRTSPLPARRLDRTPVAGTAPQRAAAREPDDGAPPYAPRPWVDDAGRRPVSPRSSRARFDPDVFVPTLGSLLVWKHLFRSRHRCGQALPGRRLRQRPAGRPARAERRRARARDRHPAAGGREHAGERVSQRRRRSRDAAPRSICTCSSRRSGTTSSSRASTRCPSIPFEQPSGHRPLDYWGRNLVDHLLRLLPQLLDDGGVALLMQLSIVSQLRDGGAARPSTDCARGCSTSASSRSRRSSTRTSRRSSASSSSPTPTTSSSPTSACSSRTSSRSRAARADGHRDGNQLETWTCDPARARRRRRARGDAHRGARRP